MTSKKQKRSEKSPTHQYPTMKELSKHPRIADLQPISIHAPKQALMDLIDNLPHDQHSAKNTLRQDLITLLVGFLADKTNIRQQAVNHYRRLAKQFPGAASPHLKSAGGAALIIGVASTVADMGLGSNLGWTDPITLSIAALALVSLSLSIYFLVSSKSKGLSRAALRLTDALQEKLPSTLANDMTHRARGTSFIKSR